MSSAAPTHPLATRRRALTPAPVYLVLPAAMCYATLFCWAVYIIAGSNDGAQVRANHLATICMYALEVIYTLATNRSTMWNWIKADFIEHHGMNIFTRLLWHVMEAVNPGWRMEEAFGYALRGFILCSLNEMTIALQNLNHHVGTHQVMQGVKTTIALVLLPYCAVAETWEGLSNLAKEPTILNTLMGLISLYGGYYHVQITRYYAKQAMKKCKN